VKKQKMAAEALEDYFVVHEHCKVVWYCLGVAGTGMQ